MKNIYMIFLKLKKPQMLKYQIDDECGLSLDPQEYFPWIKQVIELENHQTGDVFYHFCSDEFLLKINKDFLNHDFLTDIITFPQSTLPEIISGEIFISVDRIVENSSILDVEFEQEFARVMVHGILHLIGYDDHTVEDKRQMRAKEDYYLSLLPQK